MPKDKFYQLGKIIYTGRWVILLVYLVLAVICLPCLPKAMSQFTATGFIDPSSESAAVDSLVDEKIGYRHNQFIVLYESKHAFANDPAFIEEIRRSLSGLKDFPIKQEIIYPDESAQQISKNKHAAFAVVMLNDNKDLSEAMLHKLIASIKKPTHLSMKIGGQPVFLEDTKTQTQKDLIKAELIASPVAVLTLLVVFGSVMAAVVPMLLDGICAIFILTTLYLLGQFFSLSVFTLNIALLLGLCLSLDYALFMISRFRDELGSGHDTKEALAITLATAGKTVFFSGTAVFISLSALLMFPINILFSVGVGGITSVAMAVVVSVVLLPALLALLGKRINFLPIRLLSGRLFKNHNYWMWSVKKVVAFPKTFFTIIFLFLLLLGYPILSAQFGLSDFRILPANLESRQVFDHIDANFTANQLTPIIVVVKATHGNILYEKHIAVLYDFTRQLKKDLGVEKVDSIVTTEPQLSKQQYQLLYSHLGNMTDASLKKLLKLTTHKDFTVITVLSKNPGGSQQTLDLVKRIRGLHPGAGMTLQVGGSPANTVDVFKTIDHTFHYALLWIIGLTYLILLILLRSLFLPIKAILTTILSLCACYGVLVFVVQEGYFSELLHFQAQGIVDVSLLIIIFCALFGFSMDYEVFLLSRIKECYEQTGDNIKSICFGITRSSKIISSAAIIVILISFSFITADVLMVKAFGLGIVVAIFVDAFLIRTLLVPATMAILGKWNWYLPIWIGKILPGMSFNPEDKGKR